MNISYSSEYFSFISFKMSSNTSTFESPSSPMQKISYSSRSNFLGLISTVNTFDGPVANCFEVETSSVLSVSA